jgi:transposase
MTPCGRSFPRPDNRPSPPWQLALVTILPFAERRSDRQAAKAGRSRIAWQYVLRLELTASGFDASVLSEFRGSLLAGSAESLLWDMVLTWCRDRHLVQVRGGSGRTPPIFWPPCGR